MIKTKHTFFCEDIASKQLSEDESHHATKVLRLKTDDVITVIDGKGTTATVSITETNKKAVFFDTIEQHKSEEVLPLIHIAIAPTKKIDRFEFFLEKVTELGVYEITPILTSNSERKILKIDRLKKLVLSATKQSGNTYLPVLNELTPLKSLFSKLDTNDSKFIAHCESDDSKNELKNLISEKKNICILIGPEGDFTKEEIILAKENGFMPVSLGETRLRTETAGIIACHTVKLASS